MVSALEGDLHSFTPNTIMNTFVSQSESIDQVLTLSELQSISGGGATWDKIKARAKQAGDWIEGKLGDGNGIHEWSDYKDEVKWVVGVLGPMVLGVQADENGKPCTDKF